LHRAQNIKAIVRALYTLLIAGALNRPKQQEAKTRFKTWWNIVGWPMEYAAGTIGTTVNCTELMRAGEVGDEEASAVSVALTILREIWGESTFTARDVVKAMAPEIQAWSTPTSTEEADKAKAEAIADALGELVGKRLDRSTAHSIGKLFQKRLVGRPQWIGDGQAVATLRRSTGHNSNTYRIDVSVPGEDLDASSAKTFSFANPGQEHSPHSPHSPRRLGKEGKGGKVFTDVPGDDVNSSDAKKATPRWSARL
jgi:hypothetical protein